jgi:hypothetical protein
MVGFPTVVKRDLKLPEWMLVSSAVSYLRWRVASELLLLFGGESIADRQAVSPFQFLELTCPNLPPPSE